MKHTIREIFRSPKFVTGFVILMALLLTVIIYPLLVTSDPLEIIALGTFFEPGVYVNVFDSVGSKTYTLNLSNAQQKRIDSRLGEQERLDMQEWLLAFGIPEEDIDLEDTEKLLELWGNNYDSTLRFKGMTNARKNYFARLDASTSDLAWSARASRSISAFHASRIPSSAAQ